MLLQYSAQSKFQASVTQSKQLSYPSPLSLSTCESRAGLTEMGAYVSASHHANTTAATAFQQHMADCREKSTQGESIPAESNLA